MVSVIVVGVLVWASAAMNTLLGTVSGAVMDFVSGIGVKVVADVNAYGFAAVMTVLEPGMPTPSEEFSR